ncbi:hypothetical protein [Pseudomonas sp. FW305-70]|uniref:hypothetical protein n=1 Tax=Pseudomonas sp. FW305-70 TaxID=2751342 RepID=UPI000C8894A3|nr:hypothetical protein [Pseudomonas sp. FW305-70]PMZ76956.1 hypothetical protein C1X65_08220 [Pseudomonas sp. FW305-70]
MNININVNITVQPVPEIAPTAPEQLTRESATENMRGARHKLAVAKLANAEAALAKKAMIIKRLAYRQRIADKMRSMFGDDTANQFLAGEF